MYTVGMDFYANLGIKLILYSGKPSREKTFANWQKMEDFTKKTFVEQSNQPEWV